MTKPIKNTETFEPHAFWRVKRLRELRGLTLEQLAQRTRLTKSFLSKIERGVSVPSIATALSLAEAFDVRVGDLFGSAAVPGDFVVVRRQQRKAFNRRNGEQAGYRYEAIAPGAAHGLFEAFVMQPPFQVSSREKRFEHAGQEMIFVLSGKIEVSLPQENIVLNTGDCITFSGRLPHQSRSVGKGLAEALVLVTNERETVRSIDAARAKLKPDRSALAKRLPRRR